MSSFMEAVQDARQHLKAVDFGAAYKAYETAAKLVTDNDASLYAGEVVPSLDLLNRRSHLAESLMQLRAQVGEARAEANATYGGGSEHTVALYSLRALESVFETDEKALMECESRLMEIAEKSLEK